MSTPSPDAKSVFGRAAEIPSPGGRAAFLDEACAGHPSVRAEVETLLKAFGNAKSFMAAPAAPRGRNGVVRRPGYRGAQGQRSARTPFGSRSAKAGSVSSSWPNSSNRFAERLP